MNQPLPRWIPELLPPESRDVLEGLLTGSSRRVLATSLSPTARLLGLACALCHVPGRVLVVVPDEREARSLCEGLSALLRGEDAPEVLRFPALDADPYRGLPAHPSVAAGRVAVLRRLALADRLIVVLPVAALLTPVPSAEEVAAWGEAVVPGGTVELDTLARRVVTAGYRVVDVVTSPGDFARRGGLFDIWPPQEEGPLRVELWGDEVESIRRFDASNQRTVERVEGFHWLPAREAPIDPAAADSLLDRLVGRARVLLEDTPATAEGLPRLLEATLAGIEGAPRLYHGELVPMHGFTPAELVLWRPDELEEQLDKRWEELEGARNERDGDPLPEPMELFTTPARVREAFADARLAFSELAMGGDADREALVLRGRPPRSWVGRLDALPDELSAIRETGRPVVLLAHTPGRRQRLAELLGEAGLDPKDGAEDAGVLEPGAVVLAPGRLEQGLDFEERGALLLTEAELFGEDPPPPPAKRRRGGEAFLSDLRDLKEGDLVVHVDHGVARYVGLALRPGGGEELLALEYAGRDRLMVPVSRLDLIQKYSGGERTLVPLDKLGGTGWERRRSRVRREVEDIAGELLELYARRRTARAAAFREETEWQREFEGAFPHELTVDQGRSLTDIKADLASGQPMDRLLCGDVGYGKTEVALRAAFQVVQQGFQVAVLVPTTVLAYQHLNTIRARMAAWPVRVEMVSRLVSAARARQTLADFTSGAVDVLVGTHRLLGKDVKAKRLGLLVVDEEQRFGVKHKEALKALSVGVHVLSMSATPIPRTLQMSLAGVRDLSVIETPPRNRLSIQTHVTPWSDPLVAGAIRNEVRRGGQVYLIHPRAQSLPKLAKLIKELVPEVSVRTVHGQMPEAELEQVMLAFIRGDADVLVATSIVENGLDISRANTIIVSDAHRFGLSQLYQMRGRVGRSDQRAYAYLLVPSRRELTGDARRRLSALVEFSELGAGFRIAALDLEIRGAGDFLGARQSGHIAAVGFELYVQMLEEAVARQKGEAPEVTAEPVVLNLGVDAHLPQAYLPEPGQRLEVYKRLSGAETRAEIRALQAETEDRFGRLPEPTRTLFRLAELRVLAADQGATGIDWAGDAIAVRYGENPRLDTERLIKLLESDSGVHMTAGGVLRLRVSDPRADRIAGAKLALARLARHLGESEGDE